jgi:hypothetical protein
MEIIRSQTKIKSPSLHSIRGGKEFSDILDSEARQLLHQVSETFTIITGGNFKRRNQSA